jgi:hypothetical protein
MSASASGPIGALLLIAPLAAIPVLAIVGLPQFAPVAASPSEDDLDAVSLGSPSENHQPNPAAVRRGADDLFAPIGEPAAPDRSRRGTLPPPEDSRAPLSGVRGTSYADRRTQDDSGDWTTPAGALDGWELGTTATPFAGRDSRDMPRAREDHFAAAPNVPDADAVRAGFDPELLQGEAPRGDFESHEKRLPSLDRAERTLPSRNEQPADANRTRTGAANSMAEFYSKRGWLAAAARLRELGIRNYQLEWVVEDQRFVFWCTVPSGNDSRISNRFEAQDEEPLYAVQKTLADVEASLGRTRR